MLANNIKFEVYGRLMVFLLIIDAFSSSIVIAYEIGKNIEEIVIVFFYVALPWIILFLMFFNELAIGFINFSKELEALPITQKVFYFLLFYFLTFIFLIPIATPFLGMLYSIIFPFMLSLKIRKKDKRYAVAIFIISSAILSLIIFQVLWLFYFTYLEETLNRLMSNLLIVSYYFYEIAIIIGGSAAITDFVLLIYEGASMYDPSIKIPYKKIKLFQLVLIITFSLLSYILPLFHKMLVICFVLSLISFVIRKIKGIAPEKRINLATMILYVFYIINNILESGLIIYFFYTLQYDVIRFYILLYAYVVSWVCILSSFKKEV